MEQFAPQTENYLPEPKFRYTPSAREIDFAQMVASGADVGEALVVASLITEKERQAASSARIRRMAYKLLSTPAIQERLDYYLMLHKASMSITRERIQQEMASVAFSDFAQVFHKEDGPMVERPDIFAEPDPETGEYPLKLEPEYRAGDPIRNPHHIPRHIRAAIKEWRFDKDGCLVCKFHDKLKAASMLAEMEGYMDEANRAKAPQINISIGDGQGAPPPRPVEGRTIEASPPENTRTSTDDNRLDGPACLE